MVPFTRAACVRPVVDYFDRIGCPTWKYLEKAHISPALLEDPAALVPTRAAHRFVYAASRAEGVDNPGLRVAESVTLEAFGDFGALLLRSRNVFEYLTTGCRIIPMITTNEHFWLEFENGTVRFCHLEEDVDRPIEAYLLVLGLTTATIRSVVGDCWVPAEVTVPTEPPPGLADLSDSFRNVRRDASRVYASFTFPESILTVPMARPETPVRPSGEIDFTTGYPTAFESSIRHLTRALVLDGSADLPTAAEAAGMSVRTFQRRLAECGALFSSLVLEARISIAETWLRESDRPITDIAHGLGYSDSANFTRAFRRTNGLSPRAYRAATPV